MTTKLTSSRRLSSARWLSSGGAVAFGLLACTSQDDRTLLLFEQPAEVVLPEQAPPREPAVRPVPPTSAAPRSPLSPPSPPGSVPMDPKPLPAIPRRTLATSVVEYASVARIDLVKLGLEVAADRSLLSVTFGSMEQLAWEDEEIRFLTPSDPGHDTRLELELTLPEEVVILPVTLRSARPTQLTPVLEADEGDVPAAAFDLIVQGLGHNNALTGEALSIGVDGAPPFDARASSASVYAPREGLVIDLRPFWRYEAASNRFVIDGPVLGTLLASLPPSELAVDIGLTSADGEFAHAWTFAAHKPVALLQGQVVDLAGGGQVALVGQKLAVRGLDNATRDVIEVRADGHFAASGLVEGTYEVSLLDPSAPGFWRRTVPVLPGEVDITADLPYADLDKPASASLLMGSSADDDSPVDIAYQSVGLTNGCEQVNGPGSFTYSVRSSVQGADVQCLGTPTVPAGTRRIGVEIVVNSDEYPTYTTRRAKYNDTWSYSFARLSGIDNAEGSVNDTHYTQGVISRSSCIDVSRRTMQGDYQFRLNLRAANVGDSAVPTSISVRITPDCDSTLRVTSAQFESPNNEGYAVVKAVGPANESGAFVGISLADEPASWGIPLIVRYEPQDAEITSARIGILREEQVFMAAGDILSQANITRGALRFSNLHLPAFPITRFDGKVGFVVQLEGTVDGNAFVTTAREGSVELEHRKTFVPLFFAEGSFPAARRFGRQPPDPGGDSWATLRAIDWLLPRPYRFNDITGLHSPQDPVTGLSILGHTGHSDGAQIDLRYADGSGGFSEALGGAENGKYVRQMLEAAAVELASAGAGANVTRAQSWVIANRQMIQSEAAGARKIYVGQSFIKCVLMDGQLPMVPSPTPGGGSPSTGACPGVALPGVGAWTNIPSGVEVKDKHLNHWHISLKGAVP